MFPDYRDNAYVIDKSFRADQRPPAQASEIRLRVRRTLSAKGA
jgi:hypothetical protein